MEGADSSETTVFTYQVMHGFTHKERAILIFTALETSNLKQVCNIIVFFRLTSEGMTVFGPNLSYDISSTSYDISTDVV